LPTSVPETALLELKRLVSEANSRFKKEATIETCSSLIAIQKVIEPLLHHLQDSWVAASSTQEEVPTNDDVPEASIGQYI